MEASNCLDLPRELWLLICSYLTRRDLRVVALLSKSLRATATFELTHRPKFRLTDNTLNILVAGPPNSGKSVLVSTLVNQVNEHAHNEHVVFTRSLKLTSANQKGASLSRADRVRQLTFFDVKSGRKKVLTVQQLTHAAMSELLLLVVNAYELSPRAAQHENCTKFLRAMMYPTMVAMSAREVIVALNLHGDSEHLGAAEFAEAKQEMTRVIRYSTDMYPTWLAADKQWHVEYVPVNVKRGFNLTPANTPFSWYSGTDLLSALAENQKRNYFDEDVWHHLVAAPSYFPLSSAMRVRGIGTVAGGILLRGTITYRDDLALYPATRFSGDVLSVETNRECPAHNTLLPGDVAGVSLRFTALNELEPRHGFLTAHRDSTRTVYAPRRQVFAFRIAVHEHTARRLALHQHCQLFYGTARLVCFVAWRFPALDADRPSEHVILVPHTHYPVESYAPSDLQKNLRGKVLLLLHGTCLAVGRVDHVLQGPNVYAAATLADYEAQYAHLCTRAETLFSVNERHLHDEFVAHVKHSRMQTMLTNGRAAPLLHERLPRLGAQ